MSLTSASMTDIDTLLDRAGDLKRELVDYGLGRRFSRALGRAADTYFGPFADFDDHEFVGFLDRFLLTHPLADGRTVLEKFVAARGDLPRAERDMLRGWHDRVEGVFEIEHMADGALHTVNVIDDLPYLIRSNMGAEGFAPLAGQPLLVTAVVPVADVWMVSGPMAGCPASDRDRLYRLAAEQAMSDPAPRLRNPELLARARELQASERARFIAHFGADLVVLPGGQFLDAMNEFMAAGARRLPDARQGTEAPVTGALRAMVDEHGIGAAETVAAIYDEDEGLSFYADFGRAAAAFADPATLDDRAERDFLIAYLRDDSVSPVPFRRLATADPERASRVFARVLNRPGFRWDRDGERMLEKAKPSYAARVPLPRIVPISDRLAPYL